MNIRLFQHPRTRQALTIVLLLLAVSTMFPVRHPALVWWSARAAWVATGYLVLAMILLVFNRTRLMFVCLGCSAAISLYFNEIRPVHRMPESPAPAAPALPKKDAFNQDSAPAGQ